ncbi:pyridoxamine 5'-phosphate oxidase [Glaciihabitans sp. INWT7]|uniref:pyridoxamine 5'-phosphate oxidase n=1 Tax=Glaciihabitans sp. INWT7 TaxID=2596912 RepID=UPI0016291BD0|nr:pyridoxamine 5'-phosphate oxidase [Glaciihabitans sp. INWT7]QNE47854.1 pyridoxamine 5'-phosphate oxidase [Glaciihabitans sp. INWT7]
MSSLERHTDYGSTGLSESDVLRDPMAQFAAWLSAAEDAEIFEPNAMVVSTVDSDGTPSSRTVLLKGLDGEAFEFVTNYRSHKGHALSAHPAVSLLFPWYQLTRQVIVRGVAHRTDAATSDAYFAARPHGSRLAALASEQSEPVASRRVLEDRMRELESRYPEGSIVPRPEHWGGFRVVPSTIEFWQGRTSRLHDRLVFTAVDGGWTLERLQP